MADAILEVQRELELEEVEEWRRQQQECAQPTDKSTRGWSPEDDNEGAADGGHRSQHR